MPSTNCAIQPRSAEDQAGPQMAQGLTNSAIAQRLVLSERTVEARVRRVLIKLDLDDSDQANRRVLAVISYLGAVRDAGDGSD